MKHRRENVHSGRVRKADLACSNVDGRIQRLRENGNVRVDLSLKTYSSLPGGFKRYSVDQDLEI